jgi:hypothetical protein
MKTLLFQGAHSRFIQKIIPVYDPAVSYHTARIDIGKNGDTPFYSFSQGFIGINNIGEQGFFSADHTNSVLTFGDEGDPRSASEENEYQESEEKIFHGRSPFFNYMSFYRILQDNFLPAGRKYNHVIPGLPAGRSHRKVAKSGSGISVSVGFLIDQPGDQSIEQKRS